MSLNPNTVYVLSHRADEFVAYERHPIPGGRDVALVCRATEAAALSAGIAYLATKPGATMFKGELSIVSR